LSHLRRYLPSSTLILAITALYLYGLGSVGVLDPDEPRYLAIGRAMAKTHDFVTPRLWGNPWFEKPPLLYWMTSLGTFVHLGPELSGRLPVALLSLAFLGVMFLCLRREFGVLAAAAASVLLATSAGWIAYSGLALTDLPLAVFYSLAILLALPLVNEESAQGGLRAGRFALIGFCLGLGTLAKALIPIALAVPFLWYLRRWWRSWAIAFCAGLAVALPWYAIIYAREGSAFLQTFFWKQQLERLYSPALQHVQPWWYYFPVLLAALYPWTPLLVLLFFQHQGMDKRHRFLISCAGFGVLLFSVSLNKLPGYLLPLLPSIFILIGCSVVQRRWMGSLRGWLVGCAVLIGLIPLLAGVLPKALQLGRITTGVFPHIGLTTVFYMAAPLAASLLAKRARAGILLVLCLIAGGFFLKIVCFPVLDRTISARGVWMQIENVPGTICNDWLDRHWVYGLALYRGEPYPDCGSGKYDYALRARGRERPVLVPMGKK
jgi:4-amino-4-deoxy-L-arabinose transferase-like glycosyltransferase